MENIFIWFREVISHELCGCNYKDVPSEFNDMVEKEAYRRYEDWKQNDQDRLNEGREDRDNIAQAELDKRLGL